MIDDLVMEVQNDLVGERILHRVHRYLWESAYYTKRIFEVPTDALGLYYKAGNEALHAHVSTQFPMFGHP